jgi:hypothetical protein
LFSIHTERSQPFRQILHVQSQSSGSNAHLAKQFASPLQVAKGALITIPVKGTPM